MTKQAIYSYTEVCWMAFQNKWDLTILPEQNLVIVKKNGNILGEYKEIGKNYFVYLSDEETNISPIQCKCKLCMAEYTSYNVEEKVCYNCWYKLN